MHRTLSWIGIVALVALGACKAQHGGGIGPGTAGDGGSGAQGGGGGASQGGAGEGGTLFGGGPGAGGSGAGVSDCVSGPDEDKDMDGFSVNQGDCNDCDVNVNPGAAEVMTKMGDGGAGGAPGVPADEDCDGFFDDSDPEILPCDSGLMIDSNAMDGARALDICKVATMPKEWGVIDAKWVLADGFSAPANPNFDLGHGILAAFGPNVNVQRGERMLGVSSGAARSPLDPGYQPPSGFSKGYQCNHPMGFPKESPSCGVAATGGCYDSTGLELKIRVPTNAHGFSFNFNFFTFEWPVYVCTQYNDFFTAILSPIPAGLPDGNITFDNLNNPVSVNNAFVEVCGCAGGPPCIAGNKNFDCSLGDIGLFGTGFGPDTAGSDHGSTSWLVTQAPVDPGIEMKIRFVAYDSGDGVLDSTGLVDNFQWIAEAGTAVGTTPIPDPK